MRCPDEGSWQAYLDNEVSLLERQEFAEHAVHCQHCQETIKELSEMEDWTSKYLTNYQRALDLEMSYRVSQPNKLQVKNKEVKKRLGGYLMTSKFKRWTAVAASVLVMTGMLSFSPVQEALADFLSIFRVQKIETVKISPAEMEQMARAIETKVGEVDLQQFGKMEVVQKPSKVDTTLAKAQGELPFTVKQPAYLPEGYTQPEKVFLSKEGKAELQLNVSQVNNLLKSLGAKTLLPESLDGKTFSIAVPAGVRINFNKEAGHNGFTLTQFATPEVVVPPGVDVKDLRAALLDLPILPDDFRKQLASIEDWQNTMIVPDTGEGQMEKLSIAGNEAIFTQYGNENSYSNLVWVDNGVIFNINGRLAKDEAVKVAQSLY